MGVSVEIRREAFSSTPPLTRSLSLTSRSVSPNPAFPKVDDRFLVEWGTKDGGTQWYECEVIERSCSENVVRVFYPDDNQEIEYFPVKGEEDTRWRYDPNGRG